MEYYNIIKRTVRSIIKSLITGRVLILRWVSFRNIISTKNNYKILSSSKTHTFFGYYDITPFNKDSTRVLAIATNAPSSTILNGVLANVGYFDLSNDSFIQVGQTYSWCWQQGCRLMWFPQNNDQIIFNVALQNRYGSIVKDIGNNGTVFENNFPIYDLDPAGKFALFLNFSRLGRLRPGYGYVNHPDLTEAQLSPDSDGIWIGEFESNKIDLLISINQIATNSDDPTMICAEHYFNHISINPSGSTFLFFHLWVLNGKKQSRAYLYNFNSGHLELIEGVKNVSHYSWVDNNRVLITGRVKNEFGYHIYDRCDKSIIKLNSIFLLEDGHPSFFQNNSIILTDTYSKGIFNEQLLFIYDINNKKRDLLASIFHPFKYKKDYRCDLHPRLNNYENKICVDAPLYSGRKILLIDF